MIETGYNGWRNYTTWAVHTWLSADDEHLATAREIAAGRVPAERLGEWVEEHVWEGLLGVDENDVPECLGADLLAWALGQVDWQELVTAFQTPAEGAEENTEPESVA